MTESERFTDGRIDAMKNRSFVTIIVSAILISVTLILSFSSCKSETNDFHVSSVIETLWSEDDDINIGYFGRTLYFFEAYVYYRDVYIAEVVLKNETENNLLKRPASDNCYLKVCVSLKGNYSHGDISHVKIEDLYEYSGGSTTVQFFSDSRQLIDVVGKRFIIYDVIDETVKQIYADQYDSVIDLSPLTMPLDDHNSEFCDTVDIFLNRDGREDIVKKYRGLLDYFSLYYIGLYRYCSSLSDNLVDIIPFYGALNYGDYTDRVIRDYGEKRGALFFNEILKNPRTVFFGTVVSQESVVYDVEIESDGKKGKDAITMYRVTAVVNDTLLSEIEYSKGDIIEFISPMDYLDLIRSERHNHKYFEKVLSQEEQEYYNSTLQYELPIMMIDYDYSPYLDGVS